MHFRFNAAILTAGLVAWTTLQAAVAVPEVLMAFPGSNSGNNSNLDFKVGLALDGQGEAVASAFFNVVSSDHQTVELWVTDGTPEGTHPAALNRISGNQSVAADVGIFFTGYDESDELQVFRSDGPVASTRALTQEAVLANSLKGVIGDDALLSRAGPAGQSALWRLDGGTGTPTLMGLLPGNGLEWATPNQHVVAISQPDAITYAVTSLPGNGSPPFEIPVPGPGTSWDYPHRMGAGPRIACLKAFTHYSAMDIRQELNCTDGTAQGTRIPAPVPGGPGVPLMDGVAFHPVGDKLMIDGVLGSVWITDGTDAGTFALIDGYTENWHPCSDGHSGSIHFTAFRNSENQLWVTDGSRTGTHQVLSFPTTGYSCDKKGSIVPGSSLAYLQIIDSIEGGIHLFRTDGTAAGTAMVDGSPELLGPGWYYGPLQGNVALGRWLVFAAPISANQDGLWRLDLDPIFADGLDD